MKTVDTLPHEVIETKHTWITMSDGVRLAARIWRPDSSDTTPVPAILELIPYRLRDLTSRRDSIHHPYMAGHGYACIRVDIRGSGESDGVLTDEYLERELLDAEEILAWLAAQPWCSGKTGMMGMSWGGFNSLQVAARRPPSLAAIITICSTDDRYADDVHYMGGCLLSENLSWAGVMFGRNSSPPDPAIVGEQWREMWHDRLKNSGLWLETWLRHQRRDEYWQHGSVCENFSDINVPVYAISGWADGYSNSVVRLMNNLDVPRKGLIGPWAHGYPTFGNPGPAIGFLQEAVRWWDCWLKDIPNDVMDGPMLQMWMQDSVPPATSYEHRPGRWIGESRIEMRTYPLSAGVIESPLSVGQFAGKWCAYGTPPDLPGDQHDEDAGSLVFDFEVHDQSLEIAGAPVVELEVSADKPDAMIAVRLCDVAENGESTRVTYGLLNLTHHESHSQPNPLVPGRRYAVRVQLNDVAQSFPVGHRVRVAVSTSYWPVAWPSPEPVQLSVHGGTLTLPVRHGPENDTTSEYEEPEGTPVISITPLRPIGQFWKVTSNDQPAVELLHDGADRYDDIDLSIRRRMWERYSHVGNDYGSVRGEVEWTTEFSREDWNVRTETRTVLTSTASDFHLQATLHAYEDDREVFSQAWDEWLPRDCV